jgi:hypothetical protein
VQSGFSLHALNDVNSSLPDPRGLFEHPDTEEIIPIDAEIILLPEFDEELKEFNLRVVNEQENVR